MPDQASQEKKEPIARKNSTVSSARNERSPGFLFWLVALVCIFLMLIGTGALEQFGFSAESQLPEIYGTAMTLCLSCIGLGEINFKILGSIAGILVITLVVYKVIAVTTRKAGGQHGK